MDASRVPLQALATASSASRIDKPWGYELLWAHTSKYAGKILFINAGHSLSLQYHERKDEWQYVLSGIVRVEIREGSQTQHLTLRTGDGVHLPPGVIHRVHALRAAQILEVSTSDLDDVVRLDDRYGRAVSHPPGL